MSQPHHDLTPAQRKFWTGFVIVVFLLFSLSVTWFIGRPMIQFVEEPDRFRTWVEHGGTASNLLFIGMVVLQVIIALIPGEPLEIGAGYAFGFLEGTFLCYVGILLGSTFVFLLVRRFGRRVLEVFFSKEKITSLRFLQNSRRRNILLFLIMLIPGTPKDLISYFAGLLDIALPRWLLIVAISRIPSLLTSTMGGDAMGEQQYVFAAIVFAVTVLISLLGIYAYRKLGKDEGKRNK